jgi:hypothetical protein
MQPLKSQAHQVRSEGRANDEAGEQVAVQLTETLNRRVIQTPIGEPSY